MSEPPEEDDEPITDESLTDVISAMGAVAAEMKKEREDKVCNYGQLAADIVAGTILLTFGADKLDAMTPLEDLALGQKAEQARKVVEKILESKTRLVADQ